MEGERRTRCRITFVKGVGDSVDHIQMATGKRIGRCVLSWIHTCKEPLNPPLPPRLLTPELYHVYQPTPKTGVKAKEERTRKENGADDCCSQGVLADIEAAVRMEKGCRASSCICPLAPDSIAYSRTRSSRHASALTRSLPEKRRLRVEYHPDPCSY